MEFGEFAVNYNTADPSVFIKDSGNSIVKIAGQGSIGGKPAGTNTAVQFNDNELFGGEAAFTFNKGTGTLTAPVGNFSASTIDLLQATTVTSSDFDVNHIELIGSSPYIHIPADGKITGDNGAEIVLGNSNSGSGTSVELDNTGLSFKYNGQSPIKFKYATGSISQNYNLPTEMGQLSYVLGLTNTTTGQMGWIGMVPLGEWTEALIPTLT